MLGKLNSAPQELESTKLHFCPSDRAQGGSHGSIPSKKAKTKEARPDSMKWMIDYLIYFTSHLLSSIGLLTIYLIQVFSEHQPCTTVYGRNITENIEFVFQLGFTILVLDFINTNLINFYL